MPIRRRPRGIKQKPDARRKIPVISTHNAFFLQRCNFLPVERDLLAFDLKYRQRPLADSLVQRHDAPFSPEVGGVHDEVDRRLRGCVGRFGDGLGEMAADGFRTASILLCKLCGSLFAVAVKLPKGVGVKPVVAAAETLVAGGASITLLTALAAISSDLFCAAKKAFFVCKGFQLLKAL